MMNLSDESLYMFVNYTYLSFKMNLKVKVPIILKNRWPIKLIEVFLCKPVKVHIIIKTTH